MGRLIGERLLQAWERIRSLPEQEAVLAVLALSWPQRPEGELARLPLGERNALLLDLRAVTLGPGIEAFAVCLKCEAQLELTLDARELAAGLRAQQAEQPAGTGPFTMRPANTLDLLAVGTMHDEQQAQSILLARTLVPSGAASPAADPEPDQGKWLAAQPESARTALVAQFEQINAAAEIRVEVECAACHARTMLDLDIARFFLRELAAAARRLMEDVHQLASAYGWSERSIARMSGARRAAYLGMVGA
ncbi:MAG TPA: hypothetical protein VKB38_15210 [Terracidiphilus sp.]|nr:hypothetical protein [Terracidiphilus sp.]